MIVRVRWLVTALALFISAEPVLAADIEFNTTDGGNGYIVITGDIEQGDADKFRRISANNKASSVFLSSQGGSLSEAFEIGRIITVSNYTTFVLDGDWCSSACALIWIAGGKRVAQTNSHIGFHAGYTVDSGKPITSGMANALIGRYLTQLNLPTDAIVFATSATPDKMAWIDTSHPGSEGITYVLLPRNETKEPPPAPAPPIAKRTSPVKSPESLNGMMYGKWKVYVETDNFGTGTPGAEGKGFFAYFCPAGKSCRYAANIDMSCVPGDQYSINYRIDGYAGKPIEVTCDTNGNTLYLNNGVVFGNEIKGEIGVTFSTDNDKGQARSIRFNLVGLDAAVQALTKAGYITAPRN